MTRCEEIFTAVAFIIETQGFSDFSRDDVRRRIGVDSKRWLNSYTAIFQGMREDHPGKAPKVGERCREVFRQVSFGRYTLTEKGKALLRELHT